ncbi:Colicin I receptor [Ferriphaselus amnicola]|uniref:Colicin I receptor n=2 Tax=Ferriphaselus amnicola TaxID=1188319 RepID=A0A2Z6G8P3_9PROT|nr:Colicin I receptor [Ferriphaselus amnicola]
MGRRCVQVGDDDLVSPDTGLGVWLGNAAGGAWTVDFGNPAAPSILSGFSCFIRSNGVAWNLLQEIIMQQKQLLAALLCAVTPLAHAESEAMLDEVVVTATRFKDKSADRPINATIISRDDIQQSSARTLPELLAGQAGIAMRDFFGNNAASSTVDMRGFGAAAGQNTLILLDGRRITDSDLSGVQWAAIPFAAIERIEILRGSGAVQYGDGASSGVINIITRTPTKMGGSGQVSVRGGSYDTNEVQASGGYFTGEVGVDVTASKLHSGGYRANNSNDQTNAQANARWLTEAGEFALKLGVDQQTIRLPGARTVQPALGIDQVATDPRGAATPLDYASRDGGQVALEWQQNLAGADINLGLARRTKNQKSYFDLGGFPTYRDGDLTVDSFTPRVRVPHALGGESSLVVGVDVHRWDYAQRISNAAANIAQPINRIGMTQSNDAWYLQNTTHLSTATTLLAGFRNERIAMSGSDTYNAAAPGAFFGSAAPAGIFSASKNAYELGLRHQFDSGLAINGKAGRSFRFANVDEIYESGPAFTNQFQFLRPQTVDGLEFGLGQRTQAASWRATVFSNEVRDEIHLDPFSTGVGNTNLPPSRRQGIELEGRWQALSQLALSATYGYTDARFISGIWPGSAFTQTNVNIAGKHVPLVASQKVNLGASWAVSEQTRLNAAASYVGSQFMENDEANTLGMKIPAYTLVDLKLVHQVGALQLNASVNNLFDHKYYNYAVSSQFTPGRFNAYTLPGRTLFVGLGYQL